MHISFHPGKKGNMSMPLKNLAKWRECVEIMKEVHVQVSSYGTVTSGPQSVAH